jgi:hypothetical protein
VTADKSPELWRTVDRVADAVGASTPYGLVVDASFDARAWRFGWRQRTSLSLGLPLLSVLEGDEFVALIARELARMSVEDHAERLFVSMARSTLDRWHDLLDRGKLWPEKDADGGFTPRSGMTLPPRHDLTFIVAGFLANTLLWAVSSIPRSLLRYMARLTQARRAATQQTVAALVAQVSTAEAFSRLRAKMELAQALELVTQRVVLTNGPEDILTEFQSQIRAAGGNRTLQRNKGEGGGLSSLLASRPTSFPGGINLAAESSRYKVVIGDREFAAILDELKGERPAVNRKLIDAFRTILHPSMPR